MSRPVIVIHGGAGALALKAMSGKRERRHRDALGVIVRRGQEILAQGAGNAALPFNAEGICRAIGYVRSDSRIGMYR